MLLILALLSTNYSTGPRFLKEYPGEVLALKREFANVRGIAKLRLVSQGKVGSSNTIQFALGFDCDKFDFNSPKPQFADVQISSCRNQSRYFQLEKRGKQGAYKITSLGEDPASRSAFENVFGKYLHASWAVLNQDIVKQMALSQFRMVEERDFSEAGHDLVEVVFQNGDPAKNTASFRITFDPALHWAIVHSKSSLGGRVMEEFSITYGQSASGRPFMKTVRLVDVSHHEMVCEFNPTDFSPIPDREFTLEYYGFKDPARKSRANSVPLVLLGVLLLSMILLIMSRWLYRRSVQLT